MRNCFKLFGVFTLVTVIGLSMAGCNNGNNSTISGGGTNPFIGTWRGYDPEGYRIEFVIESLTWTLSRPDYSGRGTETGTYTYSGDTATFKDDDGFALGTVTVSGNVLSLKQSGWDVVILSKIPPKAAPPIASPAGGTYTTAQSVTLFTATAGASIYYTIDGTAPTASSVWYTNPITISRTTTLKVITIKDGMTNSDILTVTYTITIVDSTLTPLSDTRFNGVFTGTRDLSSIGVMYNEKLTFDGTNRFRHNNQRTENGIADTPYELTYEIEVNSTHTQYRRRLWSNRYDTWTEWLDYSFSGNTLTIQWYAFQRPGGYDVFTKTTERSVMNQNGTERTISDFSDDELYLLMKQMEKRHEEDYNMVPK